MAPAIANKNFMGKRVAARQARAARVSVSRRNARLVCKAGAYDEELIATAVSEERRLGNEDLVQRWSPSRGTGLSFFPSSPPHSRITAALDTNTARSTDETSDTQ